MRARTLFTAVIFCIFIISGLLTGCTPGRSQVRNNRGYNYDNNPGNKSYETNSFSEEGSEFGNDISDADIKTDNKKDQRQKNRNDRDDYNRFNVRSSGTDREPFEREDRSFTAEERTPGARDNSYEERSYTQKEYYQTGLASWYGREFNGRVTASGERFNMNEFTAAHKQLPFGTLVEVTNFDNGKIVKVRVNDRGPYRGKRIMDLSYGAARKLGMVSPGRAMVGIRILRKGQENSRDAGEERYSGRKNNFVEPVVRNEYNEKEYETRGMGNYSVQAGAFYSRRNAEKLKRRIEALTRNSVVIVNDGDLYKVRIKGIENRSEAGRFKRVLSDENINSFIMEKE